VILAALLLFATLEDIDAALAWLKQPDIQERFRVDTTKIALGGHSFGGAMAMAYAATDPNVLRVISIAGNDLGWFIRKVQAEPQYGEAIRQMLMSTRAPDGPVRFDLEAGLRELAEHQDMFGLREDSSHLADRSILLLGGWDDSQVTVEDVLLPLYRSLKGAGALDVTLLAYQDPRHPRGDALEGVRVFWGCDRGPTPGAPGDHETRSSEAPGLAACRPAHGRLWWRRGGAGPVGLPQRPARDRLDAEGGSRGQTACGRRRGPSLDRT
jgi:pimeloyl-ACP methyl ester carboxylesterase